MRHLQNLYKLIPAKFFRKWHSGDVSRTGFRKIPFFAISNVLIFSVVEKTENGVFSKLTPSEI